MCASGERSPSRAGPCHTAGSWPTYGHVSSLSWAGSSVQFMALARFKKLCIDANDPSRLGAFWATVLGVTWTPYDNGEGLVSGPEPHPRIWVNRVPEPKSAKHRVHLDIYTTDLARLETLGSLILLPQGDGFPRATGRPGGGCTSRFSPPPPKTRSRNKPRPGGGGGRRPPPSASAGE